MTELVGSWAGRARAPHRGLIGAGWSRLGEASDGSNPSRHGAHTAGTGHGYRGHRTLHHRVLTGRRTRVGTGTPSQPSDLAQGCRASRGDFTGRLQLPSKPEGEGREEEGHHGRETGTGSPGHGLGLTARRGGSMPPPRGGRLTRRHRPVESPGVRLRDLQVGNCLPIRHRGPVLRGAP